MTLDPAAALAAVKDAQAALAVAVSNLQAPDPSAGLPPIGNYKGVCATGPATDLARAKTDLGATAVRADYGVCSSAWVTAAKAAGLDVLMIACYAEGLATRGDHFPPDDAVKWAAQNVARAVAIGSTAVECWNEPWLTSFWQPAPNPSAYLTLLKAFAAQLWRSLPSCKLIVPLDYWQQGMAQPLPKWQDALIAADTGGLLTDPRVRPSTHNYCGVAMPSDPRTLGWAFNRYLLAYKALQAHGHPNPQVWVTEYGWRVPADVDEATQKTYITAAIRSMQASGVVERAFVFEYKSTSTGPYNLLRSDGSPRPVCAAIKALA